MASTSSYSSASTTATTSAPPDGRDEAAASGAAAGRWGFAHVPALDGLRGAAVAAVLLYHGGYLDGGYLGVDLFFVLSGFLITSLLLAETSATGRVALGSFWGRRARRLLPAMFGLLVGVAVYAHFFARPVDLASIRADGLATLFYVANWHTILAGTSYWDLSLSPSLLQHTWSLAIEEQFYLVWPLAVVGLARWRPHDVPRTVGRVALVLAAASAALFVGLYLEGASVTRLYEGTDTRAAALLLGAVLAARRSGWKAPGGSGRLQAVGSVAALVLLGLWVFLDGESPWLYRGGLPLASVVAVVVVAAASQARSGPLARVLSVRPLCALGLISYGLYLWHWPIYVVVDQHNGSYPLLDGVWLRGVPLLLVKLGLSLVAALISYRLLEQPIRHGDLRGRAGALAAVGATAGVAVLLLAATTGAVDPIGDRTGNVRATTRIDAPTVMFVGDSVAGSVVRPIALDPARYGINPVDQTRVGCSVVVGRHQVVSFAGQDVDPPPCRNDPNPAGHPAPDAVVLYLGARPNDYIRVGDETVRACDPRFDEAYRQGVTELLRTIAPDGRPSLVATVSRSAESSIPVEGSEERIACVNRILDEVVAEVPGAHLLDVNDLVCPEPGPCREELDGHPLRSDGVHFDQGPAGAAVADWLVDHLLAATGLPRGS